MPNADVLFSVFYP